GARRLRLAADDESDARRDDQRHHEDRPVERGDVRHPVDRIRSRDMDDRPVTERDNPATTHLDELSTLELVRVMNREDATVAAAVARELEPIARAVDAIATRIKSGGRLVYFGAGTSGRLGVLDASECPPTFGVEAGVVLGVIAGGEAALTRASEGAEDRRDLALEDLQRIA